MEAVKTRPARPLVMEPTVNVVRLYSEIASSLG